MNRIFSTHFIAAAAALIASIISVYAEAKFCDATCTRISDRKDVGYNNLLQPLDIDIGKCELNFTIENDCEIPSKQDTVRICKPRARERIQFHSREGPQVETIVRSCYRPNHQRLNACIRKPSYVHLFAGSKYHQRVDVGQCVGQCQETDSLVQCVPIRTFTQAFEGPNGFITIDIVKECSCKNTNCYRADFFESYTSTNDTEKVINIGKCVGSCPGVTLPPRCYPSQNNCLLKLSASPAYCVPTTSRLEKFEDRVGNEKQAIIIEACGCSSG